MNKIYNRIVSALIVLFKKDVILIEVNNQSKRPYITYWTTIGDKEIESSSLGHVLAVLDEELIDEKLATFEAINN
jgi:hypothetical protein